MLDALLFLFIYFYFNFFWWGHKLTKSIARGKKQELVLTISLLLNIPPHLDLCQRLIAYPKATIPPYPLAKWGGDIMSQMKENQEFVRAEAAR